MKSTEQKTVKMRMPGYEKYATKQAKKESKIQRKKAAAAKSAPVITDTQKEQMLQILATCKRPVMNTLIATVFTLVIFGGAVGCAKGLNAIDFDELRIKWLAASFACLLWLMLVITLYINTNKVKNLIMYNNVKKLYKPNLSTRKMAGIQSICGTDAIKKVSSFDPKLVEMLLDEKMKNAPYELANAILVGHLNSARPEYRSEIQEKIDTDTLSPQVKELLESTTPNVFRRTR